MGVCGSCGMMINGVPKLACATFLSDMRRAPCASSRRHFPI